MNKSIKMSGDPTQAALGHFSAAGYRRLSRQLSKARLSLAQARWALGVDHPAYDKITELIAQSLDLEKLL